MFSNGLTRGLAVLVWLLAALVGLFVVAHILEFVLTIRLLLA